MHRLRNAHTRQLIALLLMAAIVLVHIIKTLHTHHSFNSSQSSQQENIFAKTGTIHYSCSICEFQLAKDVPFTGDVVFLFSPAYTAPTYTRLITAINPERIYVTEGRGPPQA